MQMDGQTVMVCYYRSVATAIPLGESETFLMESVHSFPYVLAEIDVARCLLICGREFSLSLRYGSDVDFRSVLSFFRQGVCPLIHSLTPWLMKPIGSMPHSQGFSNNSYPELN